jgi:hypothetical protein
MDMKGKPLPEFSDEDWISDFAFLADMTQHLNDLSLQLQGRNRLVNDIFAHVKAFQVKLRLWEIQLTKQNKTQRTFQLQMTELNLYLSMQQGMQLKLLF